MYRIHGTRISKQKYENVEEKQRRNLYFQRISTREYCLIMAVSFKITPVKSGCNLLKLVMDLKIIMCLILLCEI